MLQPATEAKMLAGSGVTLAGFEIALLERLPIGLLAPLTLLLFTSVAYLLKKDYASVTKRVAEHTEELRRGGERLAVIEAKLDLILKGMVTAYAPKKTGSDQHSPQQNSTGGDGTDGAS